MYEGFIDKAVAEKSVNFALPTINKVPVEQGKQTFFIKIV